MRYYIIAGEASGDLHGSNLIREIRKTDPEAEIRCWGGDMMQEAGAALVKHYKDLAFMGFVEVVRHLGTILRNMRFCKKDIQAFKPEVLVLIDYPGFNIPIAEFAKQKGYKTVYYISPQVWAWKEGRVRTLKKVVDKMLVILPFEKEFYRKWNYPVEYVGHPLTEVLADWRIGSLAHSNSAKTNAEYPETQTNWVNSKKNLESDLTQSANELMSNELMPIPLQRTRLIALLPGSRKQEVKIKLPVMLEVSRYFPELQFVVAQAPSLDDEFIRQFTMDYPNVEVWKGKTYDLLSRSEAALVTSGTATLETALIGVPEVVCYKGSAISYEIAKRVIRVKYISLVNLIMDREVVKELIQYDMTAENIRVELNRILTDEQVRARLKLDYEELWKMLSEGGHASAKAARIITQFAAEKK
jgi:lipid-A-disaccharide synthase